MLVEDAAKSGANARNRVLWLVVTALLYAALTWPVILSGITGPGGPARDETNYHLPVLRQFLSQWPHPELGDYPSALAPGYYLFLAGIGQTLGDGLHFFRLVTGLFALGSVLLLQAFVPSRVSAAHAFVIALPLMALPITLRSGMWLLTDFPAFFLITLGLGLAMTSAGKIRQLAAAAIAIFCAIYFRQISAWAIAPVAVAVLQSRDNLKLRIALMVMLVLLPAAILVKFHQLWGGLTPPAFQTRYQRPNPAAIMMVLSYLGIVTPFFIAASPSLVRRVRWNSPAVVACATVGLIASVAWPTAYNLTEGRSGGPLWSIAQRLPSLAGRSIMFPPLAIMGAVGLFALWNGARSQRPRATMLVVALVAMMAAHATIHEAYERYYQPPIMLLCAWLFSLAADEKDESRMGILPIAVLAAGFFALSFVTEYYTLFRPHPLD
ncbi:MAG TPA: hypothetical protein PK988_05240 [Candidatus Sumerlaeota bacterium]|nr:hypothetical protein [Candidatus Sumerlaeota bacterium]